METLSTQKCHSRLKDLTGEVEGLNETYCRD